MKRIFLFLALFITAYTFSQQKRINYTAKIQSADEDKYPGAIILIGNVHMIHEGVTLDSQKALYYRDKNLFKALGEVIIEQGDSIIQYSDYADYNGNTKQAVSWGNVEMNDPTMKLKTDTLHFDRINQKLFYKTGGTIQDKTNTLKSIGGTYLLRNKKFIAKSNVTVTNPENNLESNHLEYYTNTGIAYLYGPSTVTNNKNKNKLYSERGFYNTKTDVSYFVKNAKLFLKERTIEGDSLYYDKRKGFASATNNIIVIDTVKNFVIKGNYAEIFEEKDSLFIIDKAVAISVLEKDSLYMHGDKILVTGKPENRIVRTFNNVKIFKSDLQGKCDSIHTNQTTGLTRMFREPVLWSGKQQITGDTIHLVSNLETNKLDSLKVLNNALIIQKDSLAEDDFNQIKGRNIYGKFIENEIRTLWVKGNAEVINFNRNEKTLKLETITKQICSDIEFDLLNNEIQSIKCFKETEGKTYPPLDYPKEERKLKGFIWREKEQPKVMQDIFTKDEKTEVKENIDVQNAKLNFARENATKKKKRASDRKSTPKVLKKGL
ncbi:MULTISPECIES: OstA-like protein [Tenacibaculum]|uniref:OstA-like protein n=1 Tax=Tenacibaculum TaxID=104267 RepID=UPI001F0A32FF|nr:MULTISPECIES: OstA-like protein [Tenacibaculum]MCH3882045.1 hypothetical protein [Tenacibaculum aquimarinum]MDO6599686.1 OstA-like protein [Tenacibaculum sp. 1_MG-2023]